MYSIKTDLGVLGGATIEKDLLVKGNAVFKQNLSVEGTVSFANATFTAITVTGNAQLADITSTGTSNLTTLKVSGDTTLGDALTDTVTVKGSLAVDSAAAFNGNITQSAGTAQLKATTVDSLTVTGDAKVDGNLSTEPTSTVVLGSTTAEDLHVKGAAKLDSTLAVTGKTTLQDVEINGTLSGSYTMDSGEFNNIKVNTLSDLNNVNIKGATTIQGNITGNTSTVQVQQVRLAGQTGIVQFEYNDPQRPSDIKTSLEPYKVSTQEIDTKDIQTDVATVGVVGGGDTHGLRALGNATIDYLKIAGNSTIGTADNFLEVTGKSVLQDTSVRNLTVTGTVSGVTFADLDVETLNVSGATTLAGANMSGNLTGGNTSTAKFSTFVVKEGDAGNKGIIQFDYSDSARPNDTKSSIEPYKIATSDLVADDAVFDAANIGDVNGNKGLHALGKATIDYLDITGNSTIGVAQPQLKVAGKSELQDVSLNNLTITGAVSGLSFTDLTVDTITATGLSSLAGVTMTGNLTGGDTSIAKFSTFTVSDGTSGNHGIVQFAYNDSARPSDTKSSVEPYKIATSDLVADKAIFDAAVIGDVNGNKGLHAQGKATADYLNITGNATIGADEVQLKVAGKTELQDTSVHDLNITGTVSGLAFTELDIETLKVSGAATFGSNVTGGEQSNLQFPTINVTDGTAGNHGIIQFAYNDVGRPSDTKSSIEPYKIATSDLVADDAIFKDVSVGNVGGTAGLTALGKSTMDYVHIQGNSTIGTAQPQLQVDGKSILGDVEFTGVVTGLTVDVSGQALTPASVVATGEIKGETLESVTTTKVGTDLTVGGDATITGDLASAGGNFLSTGASFPAGATFVGDLASAGANLTSTGATFPAGATFVGDIASAGANLTSTGATFTAGADFAGDVNVLNDTITVKDLVVTGTTTGVTAVADVDGLDIAPNSVTSVTLVKGETLESTGAATVGGVLSVTGEITAGADVVVTGTVHGAGSAALKTGDLAVTGTINATGNVNAAGGQFTQTGTGLDVTHNASIGGDLSVGGKITVVDAEVTGTLTPANIDLSTTAVNAASVKTTGNVEVGGDLTVSGGIDLANANVTAKTFTASETSLPSTLPVLNSTTITATTVNAGDIDATGDITAASVAATGDVSAASATVPSIQGAAGATGTVTLASDAVAAKDLTVIGAFKPNGGIETTGNIEATNITASGVLKGGSVESATIQAEPLGAGTVTLASDVIAAKNLTVNGTFTPVGGFDLSSVDISSKSLTTTEGATIGGNLSVTGSVDLSGADVTALSFVATDAAKTNTLPKLASTEITTATINTSSDAVIGGTLAVTGNSTMAAITATNLTASGTLDVTGAATTGSVSTGAIDAASVTATGEVSAASYGSAGATIELTKPTNVTGDFHATGTITAGAVDLSTTDVTVKSLDSLGNAHVAGNLTVDGTFDLSATNLQALTLASTNDTTVGGDLDVTGILNVSGASSVTAITATGLATLNAAQVTTTLDVTGVSTLGTVNANAVSVGTTLGVTGNTSLSTLEVSGKSTLAQTDINGILVVTGGTTLANVNATAVGASTVTTTGKALLGSLEVIGNGDVKGNLTVDGVFTPAGGLNLAGADIDANSINLTGGATIGVNLGVTGNISSGGTITGVGLGKFGSVTSDSGLIVTSGNLAVSSGNATVNGTLTSTGAGKFGSVTSDDGLTVTAGNIVQNGPATGTASFKKTSTTNLHVGTLVWDEVKYIAEVSGNTHITGNLDVDGTITAQIDLTGRDIKPRSITTSQDVSVGGLLTVEDQATMPSAVIGDVGSLNNNLQINGNTVCTGDFTVSGKIFGTLDQSNNDLVAKSVTSTTFLKGATVETTGAASFGNVITVAGTITAGGKLTVNSGGANIVGATTITGAAHVTTDFTTGGKITSADRLTVSAGGAVITGDSGVVGSFAASGSLTGASIATTGTLSGGVTTLGATTAASLSVTGTSGFTGKVTAADLESTGTITANNLTVTGTLTADIADLVTESVSTSKYLVKAAAAASATGTWTPDGSSNVYNITLTGDTTVGNLPITPGYAGSWFVYVTQDSTGGHALTLPPPYSVIGTDTAINTTANSVSICQLVYSGVGSTIDVFIAQRNV